MKRFTKPKFLEQIGRGQLGRLLEQFQPEFTVDNITLPPTTLEDKEYYAALARLAVTGPGFPENFIEALYSVEAMANAEGKGRLLEAVEQAGIQIERIHTATFADIAVQVLLADPALFAQKHDEARIAALSSFEYHVCAEAVDRRETFVAPTAAELARIKADIDAWLEAEREGEERVTEIELHGLEDEHWFLIRRGDSFVRVPTVEGNVISVRHLRPARDVVVVFNPERDELRIHGKTKGEKKMLRQVFGQRLFGDPDHFSVWKSFTLQPLRDLGSDALTVTPGEGIDRIVLTELEVRTDDEHDAVLIVKANDLFAYAEAMRQPAIPARGRLVNAGFEVFFTGQAKSRMVYLREGNKLRLTRHCDASAVHRWLAAKGFRITEEGAADARLAA